MSAKHDASTEGAPTAAAASHIPPSLNLTIAPPALTNCSPEVLAQRFANYRCCWKGAVFTILHQLLMTGIAAYLSMCKSVLGMAALLALLAFIWMLYVINGNCCILSWLERKYGWDVDLNDIVCQLFIPGYETDLHRSYMGLGIIMSVTCLCVIKLGILLLIDAWRRFPLLDMLSGGLCAWQNQKGGGMLH